MAFVPVSWRAACSLAASQEDEAGGEGDPTADVGPGQRRQMAGVSLPGQNDW